MCFFRLLIRSSTLLLGNDDAGKQEALSLSSSLVPLCSLCSLTLNRSHSAPYTSRQAPSFQRLLVAIRVYGVVLQVPLYFMHFRIVSSIPSTDYIPAYL
jgi:hypothetical protein